MLEIKYVVDSDLIESRHEKLYYTLLKTLWLCLFCVWQQLLRDQFSIKQDPYSILGLSQCLLWIMICSQTKWLQKCKSMAVKYQTQNFLLYSMLFCVLPSEKKFSTANPTFNSFMQLNVLWSLLWSLNGYTNKRIHNSLLQLSVVSKPKQVPDWDKTAKVP